MKKLYLLGIITTLLICGCGTKDANEVVDNTNPEEEITGASWRTWGPYIDLACSTPDGTENICARIMEEPAGFIFNKDEDAYVEICQVTLHSSIIGDYNMVRDSIKTEDINGDGYDDIVVRDMEKEGTFENVFLWDKTSNSFVYDDDISEYIEDEDMVAIDKDEAIAIMELTPDEIAESIVEYYTLKYQPEGDYVIFDNENVEDDEKIDFILRYQPSDAEEEQMIADGTGPVANVYVVTVTYYKGDMKAVEETGTVITLDF